MKKIIISLFLATLLFTFFVPSASAKDKEYEAIAKHLQTSYQAKKVSIPFMWLARFAVRIVKPAGVKSFSFTMFENLKFSRDSLDSEMQSAMRNSLNPEWIPLLRIRSRDGEQVYAYMRESGKDIKMMLVTINKDEAALIRATFNPDKLADFINNPRIFGVSLGDQNTALIKSSPPDSNESK
jgi:hypothetical protein